MDLLEQENQNLREEVASLREGMEKLTSMMNALLASQAQASVPQPFVTTLEQPLYHCFTFPAQQEAEPVFHAESVGAFDKIDELQEKFDGMQQEIETLRGKDLFGKDVRELCLVPDVVIPPKFKVPNFEKYKGNSCPRSHLVMYVRKMSMHADNHKLLIHFFQDSLTGAALKWYMNLDSTSIRTFNDLGEAFIRQYKYNLDMAPDRDQLRAMTQKDKETFKEYAQRWREVAAQVVPPLEEKEMTKIFLKTLGQFYYEKMVASAPTDFTEMVNMGMRLEEGVREGRLVMESAFAASSTKGLGNGFSGKKEQEVGMVAHRKPQKQYQRQPRQQNQVQRTSQFDPIPMAYAELLPALLDKNLVQTKAPPKVPEKLPRGYKSHLSCAFHQGAPGHDVEHCYALKAEVQKLIQANILSFKESNSSVQANLLPGHGTPSVNWMQDCSEAHPVEEGDS